MPIFARLSSWLDISLETADTLYKVGWIGSLCGAVVTAGAVILLAWGTRVRDHDAEERFARLNTEAGNARERAAKIEEEAAIIKSQVNWRTLAPEQITKLKNVLSTRVGAVNIRYTDGDPEALYLALQYSNLFHESRWKIGFGGIKFQNAIYFGLDLAPSDNDNVSLIRQAFDGASMHLDSIPLPPAGMGTLISTIQGAPTFLVGSRKPEIAP